MVAIHSIMDPLEMGKHASMPGGVVSGCAYPLVKNLYIIQINGFSAFMDDSHKMIAGGKFRRTPHEFEGLPI